MTERDPGIPIIPEEKMGRTVKKGLIEFAANLQAEVDEGVITTTEANQRLQQRQKQLLFCTMTM